jgi:predicted metalloprotease
MRLDELPTSDRVEDRRGLPGGRAGIGIGTVLVLTLIGWAFGVDPRLLIGGAEQLSGGSQTQQQQVPTGTPSDEMGRFVSAVLGSTEDVWTDVFAHAGKTYKPPTLVMFSGATQSGCGFAQAAMGPFYCPIDQKVYLDTSFFQDLEGRFGACDIGSKTCQFSQAYVIAPEIGHHVQNVLGLLPHVQQAQRAMAQAESIVSRCEWSCKQIAWLGSGRTARRLNGNSLSPETLNLHFRQLRPSETTGCNAKRRATWCRTHLPTAVQHNVRSGSRLA